MFNIIPVQFISSHAVEAAAKLNLDTAEVFDIEMSDNSLASGGLSREHVAMPNSALIVPVTSSEQGTYRIADGDDLASIRKQFVYLG
jgi:hypothetical protein